MSDLTTVFMEAFEGVSGHAYCVNTLDEAADIIAQVISDTAEVSRVALAQLPAGLGDKIRSRCNGIDIVSDPYPAATGLDTIDHAQVGVSGSEFAIAETGTMVEVAVDDMNRLVSSLPRTYIGVVDACTLEPTLRGAGERMQKVFDDNPDHVAVSFISGPSRTGDIEMILTLGVHGPEHAHAILLMGDK